MRFGLQVFVFFMAMLGGFNLTFAGELEDAVSDLQHAWAKGEYVMPAKKKEKYFAALQARAHRLSARFPGRVEPLIWEGIITGSHAGSQKFIAAARTAGKARDVLLAAEKIDPDALQGAALATLGSLYYKVPHGISFGDLDKARSYLKRALKINPDGIAPNFFYAELMEKEGNNAEAIDHLKKVLAAPSRPGHEDEDSGRRGMARQLLERLAAVKTASQKGSLSQ